MNKFFLIFLSTSISTLLSGMEIAPTKPKSQAIVQDLLADKVTEFRLNPVQKYWIRLFFNNQSPLCVSESQDARALVLSNAEKKCLITSCPKGGTFLKLYGDQESLIKNRCAGDCSECDEIAKAMMPDPLIEVFKKLAFSKKQREWLIEKSQKNSTVLSGARIVRCLPNAGDKGCCVIKDGDAVLVPCEVHGKKEPKRQTQVWEPFMNYALKHFVRWQLWSLKNAAWFGAGLYVASKIPESWVEYCKSVFSR